MEKKTNDKKNFTITAIITKFISNGTVTLKGVGKHRYEKSKDECLNFLESDNIDDSKLFKLDKPFVLNKKDNFSKVVLAMAMLQKKPLKLTISEDDKTGYTITEIEVP